MDIGGGVDEYFDELLDVMVVVEERVGQRLRLGSVSITTANRFGEVIATATPAAALTNVKYSLSSSFDVNHQRIIPW